jgi:hypothetical protein
VGLSSLNKQGMKQLQRNLYGYHSVFLYLDPQQKAITKYTQKRLTLTSCTVPRADTESPFQHSACLKETKTKGTISFNT